MDVKAFLDTLRRDPAYAGQIVYMHEAPPRAARYAPPNDPGVAGIADLLEGIGKPRLYTHQAQAIALAREGRNVLIATGTASGKSLCYAVPLLERLRADPKARALLLFPTKALCQDQFKNFSDMLQATGLSDRMAGVYDGDTPGSLRRKLRDQGSVIFSNPDMIHAAMMAQHGRWAEFLGNLQLLVLDELHVYSGIFGSNMALLLRRFFRVCRHYHSTPQVIACSATIANPKELGDELIGRSFDLVDDDGSPRGRKTYVLWNPPRIRRGDWRSRRSANVEAHELMAKLINEGVPTITFSKSKMSAEMIHRYVSEKLDKLAPQLVSKITPYRGGYLPEDRREIERRLFNGELVGVSTTRALELGIDVGTLEASVIVGYPGTRASFLQQAGRAGRKDQDSVVFLIGLDTSINQYIMSNPAYLFETCVEQAVIDSQNPFVLLGHLRCASQEHAVANDELCAFGPYADTVMRILDENLKVKQIDKRWYHAAPEVPQHEVALRDFGEANVIIEDADTKAVLGEVTRFDAPPIVHPGAIYMHQGDTYRIENLDLENNIATAKRVEVDYYTDPLGGTDIHHVDNRLREKEFGTGTICWGEVTAYFRQWGYDKVHFYTLDTLSRHEVDLPTMSLDTMAFWIVPPEELMEKVRAANLDAFSGLRGVGYATRMILPLFMTCDTLDFSHTVGSVNSPWNAIFVYERYPHGLGFTEKAYHRMHHILPSVLDVLRRCDCDEGCPCCVGKPLRQYATWNVERDEASIPSKAAATMILEGLLGDETDLVHCDSDSLTASDADSQARLEQALRRRLERDGEPRLFHPIRPEREMRTGYPDAEKPSELAQADVAKRAERRRSFDKDLHKRIAKKIGLDGLKPEAPRAPLPEGMARPGSNRRPTDFPGRPNGPQRSEGEVAVPPAKEKPISLGSDLASRARRMKKQRQQEGK